MRRRPRIVLDSQEWLRPTAVESIEAGMINGKPADPYALPAAGGRIDFPPNPRSWAPAVQARHGIVGYWDRVVAGDFVWVLHWLWWLDNPKSYAGFGAHEGDWQSFMIAYCGDQPVCMACAQHNGGESRMWWDVKHQDDDGNPVVYVARGSHATYFEPVTNNIHGDTADGQGVVLNPEWRPVDARWKNWTGRWGNSTGVGQSPTSPGRHAESRAPHAAFTAWR